MKYELMVILKPLLPEDIRAGVQKKLETLVKKAKGSVVNVDAWGKRHLAYPIEKHEEGYYIVYDLELDPSKVEEFQKELNLISDVLRSLLSKKDS
ncbi:MAG: 30S ribosomal protein S6 [candidate division WS6 bacterium OLB20]|uniref:Small ribosomal subunit protein bS6 n=1 Tax=candidate division WS6 bacterium OLB20 TaxID=1617426 RepID=A0A136LYA2_9BACT|nr:MAG: 30S ribosomal protein S6 [candidate division WS6 bacterium OLB20]